MSRKKEQSQKTGRPVKATFDEKRKVIDAFFIAEGGEDARIFLQHGIFTRLSDFHLAKHFNLQPYDFSRDAEVVAYMQKLASDSVKGTDDIVLPAYTPLDINGVLYGKSIKQQEEILREREEYFKLVQKRASVAIESYLDVARQRDEAIQKSKTAKVESEKAQEQIESLKNSLSEAKAKEKAAEQEARKLRAYIQTHVEPEMADAYLKDIGSIERDNLPDISYSIVMEPLQQSQSKTSIVDLFKK